MLSSNPQFSIWFSHKLPTCLLREILTSSLKSELRGTGPQNIKLIPFAFYVQTSLLTLNLLVCVGVCACGGGHNRTVSDLYPWIHVAKELPFALCELVCCRILAVLSDSGACLSGFRASCLLISPSVDLTEINQWSTCQDLLCWTNSSQPLALSLSGPLSPELWRIGLIFQRPHISVKPFITCTNSPKWRW